jgi:hypothetical protein
MMRFPRGERAASLPFSSLFFGFVLALAWGAGCGQEDPTFRPGGGGTTAKGRIFVESSIPGARISLDGADAGLVTPDTLNEVDPGLHRVRVLLAGFFPPDEQQVTVEAESLHALHFDLVQIPQVGRVAVNADFPAAILLDGSPTGLTAPDTVQGVAPGDHVMSLVLAGFRPDPVEQPWSSSPARWWTPTSPWWRTRG